MKMNDNLHVIMRHMALTVVKELTVKKKETCYSAVTLFRSGCILI